MEKTKSLFVREAMATIATESAPAAGAASIDTPEFRKLEDVLAPLPEDRKDRTRAILLNYGFTIKPGETDLKPYVYAAAQALIADALAQRAAGELPPLPDHQKDDHERMMTTLSREPSPEAQAFYDELLGKPAAPAGESVAQKGIPK